MRVQLEGRKTARGLSLKAVMLLLWFGDILGWQPSCNVLYCHPEGKIWHLGPLLPASSFPLTFFTFYRLINTYIFFLFCFVSVKPHASFFRALARSLGGKVVGSVDRIGKDLQESL